MANNQNSHGMTVTSRDLPPAHFLLAIEKFSLLRKTGLEKYESDVFEAGGFKWRLCLYPNGYPRGERFVCLSLQLERTSNLRGQWVVNAEFKLFVYDHINNKYLTVQDKNRPVKRFHERRTERGFQHVLPLETFRDSSRGYLVRDSCVFGAEVFVIRENAIGELLSMIERPANGFFKWKIKRFSASDRNSFLCKAFTVGGISWKLEVHPGGFGEGKGNSLSVFLGLDNRGNLPPQKAIWAAYRLRVMDQRRDEHVVIEVRHWFSSSSLPLGSPKFMLLGDLHQDSNGYLLNDTLIVEAEFLTLSVSRPLP